MSTPTGSGAGTGQPLGARVDGGHQERPGPSDGQHGRPRGAGQSADRPRAAIATNGIGPAITVRAGRWRPDPGLCVSENGGYTVGRTSDTLPVIDLGQALSVATGATPTSPDRGHADPDAPRPPLRRRWGRPDVPAAPLSRLRGVSRPSTPRR
ncbi:hypothetical protein SHKM778_56820 [Streptomyces sp. KM77-8]|uniref:Uncharacterized protein n=1 Tax=Streptomyces haneummycinicus TaxID=3074435 RepID=A0AAT9HQ30_9ACTN